MFWKIKLLIPQQRYQTVEVDRSPGQIPNRRKLRALLQMDVTVAPEIGRDVVATMRGIVNMTNGSKFNKIVQDILFCDEKRSAKKWWFTGSTLRLPMLDHASSEIDVMPVFMLTTQYVRVFLTAWDAISTAVTAYYGCVLVGPITADSIAAIESLVTSIHDGQSNLTVKDVMDAFMAFQASAIETFKKTHKCVHNGMTYSDLLYLFSCSPIKAIEAREHKQHMQNKLKFSPEELSAYSMRTRVSTNLRRHESASLLYNAMRAGIVGGSAVSVLTDGQRSGEDEQSGLLALCQHRIVSVKRTATDADLDLPVVEKRQFSTDGGWDLEFELGL